MIAIFYALFAFLIILVTFCLVSVLRKKRTAISGSIAKVLGIALVTIISNSIVVITNNADIAYTAMAVFTLSIDWLLFFLCKYAIVYTESDKGVRIVEYLLMATSVIDSVSIMLNFRFHHVFELAYVEHELGWFFVLGSTGIAYYLHLALCYIITEVIAFHLVYKCIKVSAFYRKKYFVILILFGVVIALDALSLLIHMGINISIFFYSLLAVAIHFFSLYYYPGNLLSDILMYVANTINNGIIVFDDHGRHLYSNDRIWEIFSTERDPELADAYYRDRIMKFGIDEEDNRDSFKRKEERIIKGETRYIDIECQKQYDKKHIYIGRYYNIIDMTDKVRSYEREVSEAQEANRAKTDYLSRMSHEIRTPVNSIYGMNEMILRESSELDIINYASDIKASAEVLVGIINDVLDLSKIESGKMELVNENYHIRTLLDNVFNMINVKAKEKRLTFTHTVADDIPSVLYGDAVRIHQILLNLLSNAIKYTPSGLVAFKVNCRKRQNDVSLYFEVKDTGIGIREEDIPRLFEAFERIDKVKNHGIQGTGLGLNITAQLLKLMGSSLKVESTYGVGSTFSFRLMQKIVDDEPIGDFDDNKVKEISKYNTMFIAPNARILIVDDNAINRKVFVKLLKQTRVMISEVESGQQCLDIICRNHFDLIFLDHLMPEMDGIETLHRMKELENNKCKDTPVIMLTANAMAGAKQEYLKEGFTDFLAKPIIPQELEKMVAKYLKS